MSKSLTFFAILIIAQISLSISADCKEGSKNCAKCNPVTKLCEKCDKNIYSLNKNGVCEAAKKCELGQNYCVQCSESGNLCQECDEGYFPDENGACSYTANCQISFQGRCLKCNSGYVLNEGAGICKSQNSEDLVNCKNADKATGLCKECNENFYLNEGDKRCISTKNCFESAFGICKKCSSGFYLDKKSNTCKEQSNDFAKCELSSDGKTCEKCIEDYSFDEDGKCVNTQFCKQGDGKGKCQTCLSGYYLVESDKVCTPEKECLKGRGDLGICLACKKGFVIDLSDGKCKSNTDENELRHCESADGTCTKCISGFDLGKDNKCSLSTNCAESDLGRCKQCVDGYYLGKDEKCTNVKHCVRSYEYECLECEDKYYYNRDNKTCFAAEGKYENCQYGVNEFCLRCTDDYYLNRNDHKCYSNLQKDDFYKCAMTDVPGEYCFVCAEGYYLGIKDLKCSKAEDCYVTEDENRCAECRENYCLNVKTGLCKFNYELLEEEDKFYYKCKKTNKEGTACETCLDSYVLDKNGLCSQEK